MRVGQKEQAHLLLGQDGLASAYRSRSTDPNPPTCSVRYALNAAPAPTLVLPACNTEAMQLHLDEIATRVAPGARAILLLDQAGWHGAAALKVPSNISLLPLPPRSPELNPQENIWQFIRQNWLSNRIFKDYDDIINHCCYAWNTLVDQPWKIMSYCPPRLGARRGLHCKVILLARSSSSRR